MEEEKLSHQESLGGGGGDYFCGLFYRGGVFGVCVGAVDELTVHCAVRIWIRVRGFPYGVSQYVAKEFGVSHSRTELTGNPFDFAVS